jgi:low affinity Fe/Cu permease
MRPTKSRSWFDQFAKATSRVTGSPAAFLVAVGVIVVWLVSGPLFRFSDTWQLVINTATTIVTFLMVFLIQHTQCRDTEAVQVKLDELLRAKAADARTVRRMPEEYLLMQSPVVSVLSVVACGADFLVRR